MFRNKSSCQKILLEDSQARTGNFSHVLSQAGLTPVASKNFTPAPFSDYSYGDRFIQNNIYCFLTNTWDCDCQHPKLLDGVKDGNYKGELISCKEYRQRGKTMFCVYLLYA